MINLLCSSHSPSLSYLAPVQAPPAPPLSARAVRVTWGKIILMEKIPRITIMIKWLFIFLPWARSRPRLSLSAPPGGPAQVRGSPALAPLRPEPEREEDQPEDVDTEQEEVRHHHLGQDVLVDDQHYCHSQWQILSIASLYNAAATDDSLIKLTCYTMDYRAACHLPMMFVDKTKVADCQVHVSKYFS